MRQAAEDRARADLAMSIARAAIGASRAEVDGNVRSTRAVLARQVAMYLARELTHLSLQEIGAWFGGRDHTTVLFGVQKTEERMRQDPRLAQLLGRLRDRLGAP